MAIIVCRQLDRSIRYGVASHGCFSLRAVAYEIHIDAEIKGSRPVDAVLDY